MVAAKKRTDVDRFSGSPPPPPGKGFKEWLKSECTKLGLKQADLCRMIGVEGKNHSQLLEGLCTAKDRNAERAKILSVLCQLRSAFRGIDPNLPVTAESCADIPSAPFLSRLLQAVPDTVWAATFIGPEELKFIFHNDSVRRLRGISPEEANRLPLEKTIPRAHLTKIKKLLRDELAKEEGGNADPNRSARLEISNYSGKKLTPVEVTVGFIRGIKGEGKPTGIVGVTRDNTLGVRMKAARALMLKEAPVGYLETGSDGFILAASHNLALALGYSEADEIVGQHYLDITHPSYRDESQRNFTKFMRKKSNTPYSFKKHYLSADGETAVPAFVTVVAAASPGSEGPIAYSVINGLDFLRVAERESD